MNIITLSELYQYNFSVNVNNALKQYWKKTQDFSCFLSPKKTNMLLYLDGVSARYIQKDGKQFFAPKGSLVYTPQGSEYQVRFFDFENENSNTIGINFSLFDSNGHPFILGKDVIVLKGYKLKSLVEKVDQASEALVPCPSAMKAGLYDIFTALSQNKNFLKSRFRVIEKGIEYMEHDALQKLPIDEVAKLCNVSEIYFRKLFKEYSGKSPLEFRMDSKIEKAKEYLFLGDISVSEIASLLGFTDSAYFCKQFKNHTGLSPLQYRMKKEKEV